MSETSSKSDHQQMKITRGSIVKIVLGLLLAAFLISFPHLFKQNYVRNLAILTCMWAIGGQGWNMISGYGSRYSMGHAVFFGLGAYTSAVLFTKFGVSPWIGMFVGMFIASAIAVIVGFPTYKLTPAYYGMATLGLAYITQVIFMNWKWVGDARGIFMPLMKKVSYIDFQFGNSKVHYYYVVLFLLVATYTVVYLVSKSKLGFYVRAMKEDELAAQSLGIDVMWNLQIIGIISASLAAMAGTFYTQYMLYIDPTSVLNPLTSNNFILTATLGGIATLAGPLIGAILFIPLGELMRAWIGGTGKAFDQMLWGIVIVLIAVFRPNGFLGWFREKAHYFQPIRNWLNKQI